MMGFFSNPPDATRIFELPNLSIVGPEKDDKGKPRLVENYSVGTVQFNETDMLDDLNEDFPKNVKGFAYNRIHIKSRNDAKTLMKLCTEKKGDISNILDTKTPVLGGMFHCGIRKEFKYGSWGWTFLLIVYGDAGEESYQSGTTQSKLNQEYSNPPPQPGTAVKETLMEIMELLRVDGRGEVNFYATNYRIGAFYISHGHLITDKSREVEPWIYVAEPTRGVFFLEPEMLPYLRDITHPLQLEMEHGGSVPVVDDIVTYGEITKPRAPPATPARSAIPKKEETSSEDEDEGGTSSEEEKEGNFSCFAAPQEPSFRVFVAPSGCKLINLNQTQLQKTETLQNTSNVIYTSKRDETNGNLAAYPAAIATKFLAEYPNPSHDLPLYETHVLVYQTY